MICKVILKFAMLVLHLTIFRGYPASSNVRLPLNELGSERVISGVTPYNGNSCRKVGRSKVLRMLERRKGSYTPRISRNFALTGLNVEFRNVGKLDACNVEFESLMARAKRPIGRDLARNRSAVRRSTRRAVSYRN